MTNATVFFTKVFVEGSTLEGRKFCDKLTNPSPAYIEWIEELGQNNGIVKAAGGSDYRVTDVRTVFDVALEDLLDVECGNCKRGFNHAELVNAITDRTDADNKVCPHCHSEQWALAELET